MADSVRLALPAEAATVAAVQRRAWATDLDQDLSQWLLTEVDLDAMTTTWHAAITRPPDARCRLLVGVDGASGAVVGFVATSPGDDPDADPARDGLLGEWVVDPQARRRGHGSRLLNAAVDTLRADGFTRAQIWLAATDDVRRQLLHESGWAPDGGHREVGPTAELAQRQVRLHTDITDAGEA
ncbi:N-acetyltransferase family protein [Propionibacteriaceae bacterium Y2011]|uniref:GNAT family N-acetyltransferase n=1 Tax=Microlunatus sp. Y2014 TaxID=3418488 RepID=UPI003B49F982